MLETTIGTAIVILLVALVWTFAALQVGRHRILALQRDLDYFTYEPAKPLCAKCNCTTRDTPEYLKSKDMLKWVCSTCAHCWFSPCKDA